MDTSLEYIEMCKAAEEIQSIKNTFLGPVLSIGDNFCHDNKMFLYPGTGILPSTVLFVPRQDQLQEFTITELFKNQSRSWEDIYSDFADLWFNRPTSDFEKSFEKMWLKYYMREVHVKKWNEDKKEWIY